MHGVFRLLYVGSLVVTLPFLACGAFILGFAAVMLVGEPGTAANAVHFTRSQIAFAGSVIGGLMGVAGLFMYPPKARSASLTRIVITMVFLLAGIATCIGITAALLADDIPTWPIVPFVVLAAAGAQRFAGLLKQGAARTPPAEPLTLGPKDSTQVAVTRAQHPDLDSVATSCLTLAILLVAVVGAIHVLQQT